MTTLSYEPNDHFDLPVLQCPDSENSHARDLQAQIRVLSEDCDCLDGGTCSSGKHERYRALLHELMTNHGSSETFKDVSSCMSSNVACASAIAGNKDSVALGLDAICLLGGVMSQVLEEHPHNILSMIKAIAKVPRQTSTAMSARSNAELRKMVTAAPTIGVWYHFAASRICSPCTMLQKGLWWSWAKRRGADSKWMPGNLDPTYSGELPCGWAHMSLISLLARTGGLADGIYGDYCTHVVLGCRSALYGNTLSRYIMTVLLQAGTQLAGDVGNHASGWGAAKVLATVVPVWDELWLAFAADGESPVPMASVTAYSLASDDADDIHCTVLGDGEIRYVMYNDTAATLAVLHDVTLRMETFKDGSQPVGSMAIINMWRDHIMRRWNVDKDMCFDRYVQAYLKKESVGEGECACDSAGISWIDVRSWHSKNRGARAVTSEILSKRGV